MQFSDGFRLGSPFGFVEPPTTLAVDVQRRFRQLVAARRLEAPEPQPMRPPFPSRLSLANVSPIGLSTRRRVDDMDGRRRVVPEGSAFAAANGFEKPRRPARRLLRTSGGNFMDASNHGLCGLLGKFTVRFCCYYRCSLLRVLRDVVIHEVPIEMLAPRCGTCGSPARGLRRSRAASRVFGRRRAFRVALRPELGLRARGG